MARPLQVNQSGRFKPFRILSGHKHAGSAAGLISAYMFVSYLPINPSPATMALFPPALAAPGMAENVLSGPDAATNNKQLVKSIDWLTSLEEARKRATREGKLILWLHMLGNIDGFT